MLKFFVGHDFSKPPLENYRQPFKKVEETHAVRFIFADDRYAGTYLLSDIEELIKNADHCLFDLSRWNFNVGLELGLAQAHERPFFLLIHPIVQSSWFGGSRCNLDQIPSDIQGIRYHQYKDAEGLEKKLTDIVNQCQGTSDALRETQSISSKIQNLLGQNADGLYMFDIAARLNLDMSVTQGIVKRLIKEGKLTKTGQGSGTKYHASVGLEAAG